MFHRTRKRLVPERTGVPVALMRYTCGFDDEQEYDRTGEEVATMLDLALRRHTGRPVTEFSSVLDFGCGTGRLARHLHPAGRLHGCDVNAEVVRFAATDVPHGEFHQSPLLPPLRFPDSSFDLVCSFSVFSHLRLDVERAWLAELTRVGAPGCVYLLTVQGDWMIDSTLGEQADAAREAGFFYRDVHERSSNAMDFPDYYESSYHTSDWIRREWAAHFEVLEVIKGEDPARYLSPGLAFAPHGDVPLFRPMGQDLVVAVKR